MSVVYVRDAKNKVHMFGPDDEVPDWAKELITNKRALEKPAVEEGFRSYDAETPIHTGPKPPPKAGPGSGREKWAAYLHKVMPDVEASPDDSREDIIAFLKEAGHRVD